MIVAQKQTGKKVVTKNFSDLAWSLLGNDKQGWTKVEQSVQNKVLTEPPTGDEKEVVLKSNNEQTVDNKAVNKEQVVENKVAAPDTNKTESTDDVDNNASESDDEKELGDDKKVVLPFHSKDYPTTKEAIAAMDTLTEAKQVKEFIVGEDRAKVLKHAQIFLAV